MPSPKPEPDASIGPNCKRPWGEPTQLAFQIEVAAARALVFQYWTRYEAFPAVMDSVRHVKRIHPRRILWDIDIAGLQVVWDTLIEESVPPERIAWRSQADGVGRGRVEFESLGEQRTRVRLFLQFQTRGFLGWLAARLGVVETHMRQDLAEFRRWVEAHANDDDSPRAARTSPPPGGPPRATFTGGGAGSESARSPGRFGPPAPRRFSRAAQSGQRSTPRASLDPASTAPW